MRRAQKEIEKLVKEQEASGLSVANFCAQRGLPAKNFYAWRQQTREAEEARFARVETSGEVRLNLSYSSARPHP